MIENNEPKFVNHIVVWSETLLRFEVKRYSIS